MRSRVTLLRGTSPLSVERILFPRGLATLISYGGQGPGTFYCFVKLTHTVWWRSAFESGFGFCPTFYVKSWAPQASFIIITYLFTIFDNIWTGQKFLAVYPSRSDCIMLIVSLKNKICILVEVRIRFRGRRFITTTLAHLFPRLVTTRGIVLIRTFPSSGIIHSITCVTPYGYIFTIGISITFILSSLSIFFVYWIFERGCEFSRFAGLQQFPRTRREYLT